MRAGWPHPSLTRRLVLALLGGFALIWLVLMILLVWRSLQPESGELDVSLRDNAALFARALDETKDVNQVADELGLVRRVLTVAARESSTGPVFHVGVLHPDGRWLAGSLPLESALAVQGFRWDRLTEGFVDFELAGTQWRGYVSRRYQWPVITFVDGPRARSAMVHDLVVDLSQYIAIALPLAWLPIWLAARTGLRPLRELGDRLGHRAVDELAPVSLDKPYTELVPLVESLNGLLTRLGLALARERQFLQDAAHELRTPLAVAMAQMHLISTESAAGPREEAAQRAAQALRRLSKLTQQLLSLASLESRGRQACAPLALMDLLREALADVAEQAAQAGMAMSLAGPPHLTWTTDADALRSIVDNLLDNAIKYAGFGSSLEVQVSVMPGQLTLRVIDDGCGIPPSQHAAVFDRFHRLPHEPGTAGVGLGLAVVREAARSLGGEVRLTPGPEGAGCCFEVVLPELR